MSRGSAVTAFTLVLLAAGCGGTGKHAGGRPLAVTVAWTDAVRGAPGSVTADAGGLVATIGGDTVVALDRDGKVQWSVPLDGASTGRPVIAGDRVIVPVSRAGGSGGCVGLDRDTGETHWTYEAVGTRGVAAGQADEAIAVCVMRNGITAGIAINSGFVLWQYAFGPGPNPVSGTVADRADVAIGVPKDLFAFTAKVGRQWVVTLREITTGGGLGNYELGTADPPSAPVNLGHGLIAVAQSDPARLLVHDANAPSTTKIAIPGAGGFDPAVAPVVAGGMVVVAARSGEVTAIDIATRRARWAVRTPSSIRDPRPEIVGDAVLVTGASGQVVAYGLANGAPVELPAVSGSVVAAAGDGDPSGGDVMGSAPGGGWIERWTTGSRRGEPAASG